MLKIEQTKLDPEIAKLCKVFINSKRSKYILGRNERAKAVSKLVDVNGFVDDYSVEHEYQGRPILNTSSLPKDALVLITSICNPISAQQKLDNLRVKCIDYFSFLKYVETGIPDIEFQKGFSAEFKKNRARYERVYELLTDAESKRQYQAILNFRLNYDLRFMHGFCNKEKEQYFEDFLELKETGEVFVDAGSYDGYTTSEFIRRCPKYKAIHLFEPDFQNLEVSKRNLKTYRSINFYPLGLYSEGKNFRFSTGGSASRISPEGEVEIKVEALDNQVSDLVTFIKMDIEGAEIEAIKGAKEIIQNYKPRLAISAYHKPDDLWKIPETVLKIRNDYKVFIKHYMEGITETVLFFV